MPEVASYGRIARLGHTCWLLHHYSVTSVNNPAVSVVSVRARSWLRARPCQARP